MMDSNQVTEPVKKLRLNPFAFPSATDFRFWLLILAVLGASLFTFERLYFSVPANQERYFEAAQRCLAVSPNFNQPLRQALSEMDSTGNCMAAANLTIVAWGMLGVVLLIAVAVLLYWFSPGWKIKKDKLEPLLVEDAPEVMEMLGELTKEAGLDRSPAFLWNPLNLAAGGVAFGRLGRYCVALSGGLVTLFYTDLPAFKAIVLHELAHIKNKDIDKTYLTVNIWRAYVLVALLPLVMSLMGSSAGVVFGIGWRAGVLALLVYLTRNAVLRTREVYADVRASSWGGAKEALERVLVGLKGSEKNKIESLLQVHPDPAYRQAAVKDPAVLFKISIWDSLAVGIAASISFASLEAIISATLPNATLLPSLIAASLLASMAAGVVGLEVWRAVFASQALTRWPVRLLPAWLGLGVGIWIGRNTSFLRYIEIRGAEANLVELAARLGFTLVWMGVLLLGLMIWSSWVAGGASVWLKIAATQRDPRLIMAGGLGIAGFSLVVWLGSLLFLAKFDNNSSMILMTFLITALALPSVVAYSLITLLVSVSLWIFPISAWLWRNRIQPVSEAEWAYMEPNPIQQRRPAPLQLNPWRALATGLGAGLVFCAVFLLVRGGLRVGLAEAVRDTDQFKLMLHYGSMAGAVLLQGLVAGVVALWLKRLALAHGLLGAFGAGSLSAAGILAINLLFGGSINFEFAWQTYSMTVNLGALLAIPAALMGSLIGSWLVREEGVKRPAWA
jgi:Zn-dependent protease with chaperone function